MRLNHLVATFGVVTLVSLTACNNAQFKGSAEKLNPTVTKEFTQESYPDAATKTVQGFSGDPLAENFEQGEFGLLDILVVIDNSGSMAEEQANLSTKLSPLLSKVDKADWQVKIVTTDPADGCSGVRSALIKKAEGNAAQRFADTIVAAGTKGSGTERPFLQAVNGLKCQAAPWVRDGSTVVVLIVTDEDNCHVDSTFGDNRDYNCGGGSGQADLQATFLTSALAGMRTLGKDAKIYGLYKEPGNANCTTALATATLVDQAVQASGGHAGSICEADYTPTLTDISGDVAQILKYEFDLKDDPDQGTLKILVDGQPWTKFTLEGRKVKFSEPPPFGSKVEVQFTHGKDGSIKTEFPLDKLPVDGTIKVEVNGAAVDPAAYGWDEATKRLKFKSPPTEKAELKITYKEKTALKTTWTIDKNADPKAVKVEVNGVAWTDFTYDPATGVVTFGKAPAEAAKIRITYRSK